MRQRAVVAGVGAAVVVAFAYLGALTAWVALSGELDAPEYEVRSAVRRFFVLSVWVSLGLSVPGSRWVRRHGGSGDWPASLMSMGVAMTTAGVVGILWVVPGSTSLANAGGLVPDFGHVVLWSRSLGPLWLFLLVGAVPYGMGWLAATRRGGVALVGLVAVLTPVGWYVGVAVEHWWQQQVAP